MSLALEDTFRCPTCRAPQELSDTCRRCKCDLRLVGDALRTSGMHRARALMALQSGEPAAAMRHARECLRIAATPESLKLFALCSFRWGDWPAAEAAARRALELEHDDGSL